MTGPTAYNLGEVADAVYRLVALVNAGEAESVIDIIEQLDADEAQALLIMAVVDLARVLERLRDPRVYDDEPGGIIPPHIAERLPKDSNPEPTHSVAGAPEEGER